MNFIKIKDDYINLDNVTDIRVSEHSVIFYYAVLDEVSCEYQDETDDNNYYTRPLTTEELQQLKERVQEKCNT